MMIETRDYEAEEVEMEREQQKMDEYIESMEILYNKRNLSKRERKRLQRFLHSYKTEPEIIGTYPKNTQSWYLKTIPAFDSKKAVKNNVLGTEQMRIKGHQKITITEKVYDAIQQAVEKMSQERLEVGGLLKVKRNEKGFEILGMNIMKQEVSSTDFDISENTMASYALEHMEDDDFSEWNSWWHSHHTMGLFWSGTDDTAFEKLMGETPEIDKFVVGLVFVTSGNFRARIDYKTPLGVVTIDNISVDILREKSIEENISQGIEVIKNESLQQEQPKPAKQKEDSQLDKYLQQNVNKREYATTIKKARDYVIRKDVWEGISYPTTMESLQALTEIHKTVFSKWDLGMECAYWGLDGKKIEKEIKSIKKEQKRKEIDTNEVYVVQ